MHTNFATFVSMKIYIKSLLSSLAKRRKQDKVNKQINVILNCAPKIKKKKTLQADHE